jgi:hypothetical protein
MKGEKIMKPLRAIIIVFLVAFIAVAVVFVPGDGWAASKKLLAMGTTQSSSSHYGYFVAVAKIINTRVPDVNISVVETGAVDNINRIKKGSRHGHDDDPPPIPGLPRPGRLERQTHQRPVCHVGLPAGPQTLSCGRTAA